MDSWRRHEWSTRVYFWSSLLYCKITVRVYFNRTFLFWWYYFIFHRLLSKSSHCKMCTILKVTYEYHRTVCVHKSQDSHIKTFGESNAPHVSSGTSCKEPSNQNLSFTWFKMAVFQYLFSMWKCVWIFFPPYLNGLSLLLYRVLCWESGRQKSWSIKD